MIIHHQTGQKSSVLGLVKTVRVSDGSYLLCYDDPITKAKGIVELHGSEIEAILAATLQPSVSSHQIMRAFAGIRPHGL